jgi:hypothetical protein
MDNGHMVNGQAHVQQDKDENVEQSNQNHSSKENE